MFVAGAIVASHSTTHYPRIVCEINREREARGENETRTQLEKTSFKTITNCIFTLENIKLRKYERIEV